MVKAAKVDPYDIRSHSLRDIINYRLESMGQSRYAVANSGMVDLAPATVYRYLNGETDSVASNVEQLLRACGLRIVAERRKPIWVTTKRYSHL